jgi:hypothetical protein
MAAVGDDPEGPDVVDGFGLDDVAVQLGGTVDGMGGVAQDTMAADDGQAGVTAGAAEGTAGVAGPSGGPGG